MDGNIFSLKFCDFGYSKRLSPEKGSPIPVPHESQNLLVDGNTYEGELRHETALMFEEFSSSTSRWAVAARR